jgi:peptidoglycan/xylan/chitin deacetylase (PgdA/CDA1 family)
MGTDWERLPTSEPVVALTFDGGSSEAGVASVLSTLAAHGVRATVFVTGDFARRYPAQVRRIAAAGHVIGNHSDRHDAYPDLTDAQIRSDLARAREAIVAAGGGPEAGRYFRFPFGARTPADIRVVNAEGYVTVRWTVDTLGWKGTSGGLSAAQVRNRVLSQAQAGQIVLMHLGANPVDGTTLDADALAGVITGLKDRGYSFVTVDELLS